MKINVNEVKSRKEELAVVFLDAYEMARANAEKIWSTPCGARN